MGGQEVLKILDSNGVELWHLKDVPKDYTRVEYLESASFAASDTNKAYIDLGIKFDTKARSEIKAWQVYGGNIQIFGAAENSGVLRYMLTVSSSTSVSTIYGSTGSAYNHVTNPIYTGDKAIIYKMSAYSGNLSLWSDTYGNTNVITTQGSYTMTNNLHLFGQNYNGTCRGNGLKRIYYFKHWDKNDNLVLDLLPCVRNSDNEPGMYNLVDGTFFTNAGTGHFLVGG